MIFSCNMIHIQIMLFFSLNTNGKEQNGHNDGDDDTQSLSQSRVNFQMSFFTDYAGYLQKS